MRGRPPKTDKMEDMTAKIPLTLKLEVKRIAKEEDRSFSACIRRLLEEAVNARGSRPRP